jgi:hypothetical protein
MDKIMLRLSMLLFAVTMFAGCAATHPGYLLKTDTGQRSSVLFHDNPTGKHGNVEAVLANGEQCRGQFNTVPNQVTRNSEDYSDIESEDTQVGLAVLQCTDNHIVKCDFSRAHEGPGSGHCSDNLGQKYSLNF